MSALDRYHQSVVNALIKDGWTITHQPLTLTVEFRMVRVDIRAER
ncbi:MAG: element excision factor XisH family protein [Capsulimonadales bacterium]|nr:element excision factor XisH family protein [Capsulimonadales bacterium]